MPILSITPLRSSLPVVPAAKGERSALAMARTVIGQTAEVLGALVYIGMAVLKERGQV